MTMSLDSVEEVPAKQYAYLTRQLHKNLSLFIKWREREDGCVGRKGVKPTRDLAYTRASLYFPKWSWHLASESVTSLLTSALVGGRISRM